ncbi:hypothetical protein B0H12DRAFT_1114100 [Mycena haematopus]|nr:hypothetical protein B0H12DRAFT_1114100 [Mycena haematopus]
MLRNDRCEQEAGIDARYRSSDLSSGRPTYKIRKKTRAHFLGKKNMTVDVSRSLAWDSTTATATLNGSKSYATVFSAHDQSSRSVALQATNSVLSKTSFGEVLEVSTVCGAYDPTRTLRREIPAHHFFALKLNPSCVPDKAASRKRGGGTPVSSPSASPSSADPQPYIGGGYFVLDSSAPPGRSDLLTTLYCTGYEQRPRARAGDIAIAELRLPPRPTDLSAALPPPWARFFKERHAVLHIARRGLGACMTGPHVRMTVPGIDRAVLARGQALEVVLSAVGTALLAVEHDGLEGKRWAWLVHRGPGSPSAGLSRMGPGTGVGLSRTATGTRPLPPAPLASPPAAADNPGLAPPDEGTDAHSDDSQSSPSRTGAFDQHRGGVGLFAPPGHDRQNFGATDGGGSVGGEGEDLDTWVVAEDVAHPGESWARKNSVMSYSTEGTAPIGSQHPDPQQQHFKAGSWPERRSVMILDRPDSQFGLGENPNYPNAPGGQGHANGNDKFARGENLDQNGSPNVNPNANPNAQANPNPNAHANPNPNPNVHANPNPNLNNRPPAPAPSTFSRVWKKQQHHPHPTPHQIPYPHPTSQEYIY